jgi:hypothetical protein
MRLKRLDGMKAARGDRGGGAVAMGGCMVTLYLIIQNSSKSMSTHGIYTRINPQHESNVTKCYQVLQIVTEMLEKYGYATGKIREYRRWQLNYLPYISF